MSDGKLKGLIVDDLPASRVEIREYAEVMGHEWIEAATVEESRELLREHKVDYVVLDLQLPMRSGRPDKIEYGKALLDEIVRQHPYVGIVVVTAHGKTHAHVVDVMSRSPLIAYVPKPFDDSPDSPRLTEQIQAVLGRAESYRRDGQIPGTLAPNREEASQPGVSIVDVREMGTYRKQGVYCLVDGKSRRFSHQEHRILRSFEAAQQQRTGRPDQHAAPVNADAFGISDDFENRHSTMSRLRKRLRGYLPENYDGVLESVGDRTYSLGCICVDSTPEE